MAFRIYLLFVYISLYMLLWYGTDARTLERSKQSPRLGFSWNDCGSATDPIRILSLSIGPDPIRLPGNVVLSTSINISRPLPADIYAHVGMQKNVFGIWVNVPCDHGAGSCSYSVCTNKTETHPTFFENYYASKTCPSVLPAIYGVTNLVMAVTKSIPSIADGEFRMNIDFLSNYAGHLACLHLDVHLN